MRVIGDIQFPKNLKICPKDCGITESLGYRESYGKEKNLTQRINYHKPSLLGLDDRTSMKIPK
jgi:hypothetical protein